jgi:hypothetical protein
MILKCVLFPQPPKPTNYYSSTVTVARHQYHPILHRHGHQLISKTQFVGPFEKREGHVQKEKKRKRNKDETVGTNVTPVVKKKAEQTTLFLTRDFNSTPSKTLLVPHARKKRLFSSSLFCFPRAPRP